MQNRLLHGVKEVEELGDAVMQDIDKASDQEAERLHDRLNPTDNFAGIPDCEETLTPSAQTQSYNTNHATVSSLTDVPSFATDQARFDALLSVGVFDHDKPVDWRKAMEQRVSDRFTALSSDGPSSAADRRTLWFKAAKQVQQEALRHQLDSRAAQLQNDNQNEQPKQLNDTPRFVKRSPTRS